MAKIMNRYHKNLKSVKKICEILGYRLVGYDPDWSIAVVEEKLPNSRLLLVSSQMRGQYDQISDEFMGRISLMMGLEWEFEISDNELIDLIAQFKDRIKEIENQNKSRLKILERVENVDNKNSIEEIKKYNEDYIKEYEEKIKILESTQQFRQRLKNLYKKSV